MLKTALMSSVHILSRIPIRYKLVLTYSIQLIVILLGFSLVLRLQFNQSLTAQIDETLLVIAGQAEQYVIRSNSSEKVFALNIHTLNISPQYQVILISPEDELWDAYGPDAILLPNLSGHSRYFTIDDSMQEDEWRVYQQPLPDGEGWIQVAYRTDIYDDLFSAIDTGVITAVILIGALSIVMAILFTAYVLRPLRALTQTIGTLSTQNLAQRLSYSGANDEIGMLATTFDAMLERLEVSITREKQFIDNAAHELRTPLTATKGHLSVTLSQERTSADYRIALSEIDHQISRLIKLSNDLLFLSRMKHAQLREHFEKFDFYPYLEMTLEQFRLTAEKKAIILTLQVDEPLIVWGDVDLLIRMLSNLLDNAVKYTPTGGSVSVHAEEHGQWIKIRVSNTGDGIPTDKLPYLFERFYRVEDDRGRNKDRLTQGSGLGLAIVKEIIDLHSGAISVDSTVGSCICVKITLLSAKSVPLLAKSGSENDKS